MFVIKGGKKDHNENPAQTASREFNEETGCVLQAKSGGFKPWVITTLKDRFDILCAGRTVPGIDVCWFGGGKYILFMVQVDAMPEISQDVYDIEAKFAGYIHSNESYSSPDEHNEMSELKWVPLSSVLSLQLTVFAKRLLSEPTLIHWISSVSGTSTSAAVPAPLISHPPARPGGGYEHGGSVYAEEEKGGVGVGGGGVGGGGGQTSLEVLAFKRVSGMELQSKKRKGGDVNCIIEHDISEKRCSSHKTCKRCDESRASQFSKKFSKHGMCRTCIENEVKSTIRDQQLFAADQKQKQKSILLTLPTFTIDIPESNVIIIDNHHGLNYLQEQLLGSCVAGIDTETKPMFVKGSSDTHPTALLQIATRSHPPAIEHVFIIDLYTLSRNGKTSCLENLFQILLVFFADCRIVKIGQGLNIDMLEVLHSYSHYTHKLPQDRLDTGKNSPLIVAHIASVVECSPLHHELAKTPLKTQRALSLQLLTQIHLNMNLVKSKKLTLSNWHQRPLSHAQVQYAACDALVLLRLFDTMTAGVGLVGENGVDVCRKMKNLCITMVSPTDDYLTVTAEDVSEDDIFI
jgi:8-oxo-dGTP pyrophosphatase MutT (NUDIX family)